MTKRLTIDEVLAGGVISQMAHIDAAKVAALFPTESDVRAFDTYFLGNNGEREISYSLGYYAEKSQVDAYLSAVLAKYFNSWQRVRSALETEYDVLENGESSETYTETRSESGETNSAVNDVESVNAFDSSTPSESESNAKTENGGHSLNSTVERTITRTASGVNITNAEKIRKEITLRNEYNFFHVIEKDLQREICADVYGI